MKYRNFVAGLLAFQVGCGNGCMGCGGEEPSTQEQLIDCLGDSAGTITTYSEVRTDYREKLEALSQLYLEPGPNLTEQLLCERHNSAYYQCLMINRNDRAPETFRPSTELVAIDTQFTTPEEQLLNCQELTSTTIAAIARIRNSIGTIDQDIEIINGYRALLSATGQ
jgi:hypothetical protein